MPFLYKWSWVDNLPRMANQRINECQGIDLLCHTRWCQFTRGLGDRIPSQASLIENLPLGAFSQMTLSLIAILGFQSLGMALMISSHSEDPLGQFQSPPSPSMIAPTLASSPKPEAEMKLFPNLLIKGPRGCQLSYQREVEFPFPTTHFIFNRARDLSFSIFLHVQEQKQTLQTWF